MNDLWQNLQAETRPIALYGMGNGAEAVLRELTKRNIKPVGIFASDGFVRKKTFCGFEICSYAELAANYPDMVILVCFGSARGEVMENIKCLSTRHTLYCPDVPVYGDAVFTLEFARKNSDNLRAAYACLSDDESRSTFANIVYFKLTGKPEYLRRCEREMPLFAPLSLTDSEIYVDLGAYRGDTVEEFVGSVKGYKKIFAVEPNVKNFTKLKENTASFADISYLNAAIGENTETRAFAHDGRGGHIASKGVEIEVISVDTLLNGESASLIKMDVEGAEREAILGAEQTIRKYRPKLIVSAYHRSEDIFDLPQLVLSLRSDYRVKLMHTPHNLAWDTDFYFY